MKPRLWRRIDVPVSSTLLALHDIIQIAVGWTDSHLFEFVIRDRVYGEPMPDDDFWDRHVRRQLFLPVALPHLGMLPTVLRKIVLRFQPGTGQFLVTRPARARWRDSIGGNVSAHHRVSCPVHAGARHAGDLVDHHGLYGTGCRRRRRAPDTGHRTPDTGHWTPASLPPVCDRGRGRASRRRGDAAPASAFRRRPLNGGQVGRLDPSGAAMHKLLVLANALVGQNRPGEDRTISLRTVGNIPK